MSNQMGGMHPVLLEASISVMADSKKKYYDCLNKLSIDFNIDYDLLSSISEISLSEYNPD